LGTFLSSSSWVEALVSFPWLGYLLFFVVILLLLSSILIGEEGGNRTQAIDKMTDNIEDNSTTLTQWGVGRSFDHCQPTLLEMLL
jgi:hypothetical protein